MNRTQTICVCSLDPRGVPPLSPLAGSAAIAKMGINNQVVFDNWTYFLDDQDHQIHGEGNASVLAIIAATCSCGGRLYESASHAKWKPAKDGKEPSNV